MARRGTILFEVVVSLAIVGAIAITLSRSLSMSRRAAQAVTARAVLLRQQVRTVSRLCECDECFPNGQAALAREMGQWPRGGAEWRVLRQPAETLVLVRLHPADSWRVVCGAPGTKRWPP